MSRAETLDSAAWKSRGYGVVRGALDASAIGELRRAMDEILALAWAVEMGRKRGFVLVHHPEEHHPLFARTGLDDVAERAARHLLGEGRIDHRALWYKPPGTAGPIPWHQDDAYKADADAFDSFGVWMPLDDVDVENGCLELCAGSYRSPVAPHAPAPGADVLLEAAPGAVDAARVAPCPVAAGDAILFSSRTLHASRPNRSGRPRRVLALLVRVPRAPAS